MKKLAKVLLLIFLVSFLITSLSAMASATDEEKVTLRSAYAPVYGGAKAIATLTFDDSIYPTALLVQQMCEKYGMEATMMMIVERIGASGDNHADAATWAALFAKGQIEPQSHSYSHIDLRSTTENGLANQSEANFQRELADSKSALEEIFPQYDCISFASSFGSLSAEATAVARAHYYSIRGVSGKNIQTTNPGTSGGTGSWANLYAPGVTLADSTEEEQIAHLKGIIDSYVEAGGWYTPFIHKVGDVSGAEMSAAVTDAIFAYLDTYQEAGDLWVTKHSSAVKYIRERQNSTSSAYMQDGKIYVSSTMASETADGLPLPLDVFNHPLTVAVALPADCAGVNYTLGGKTYYREALKSDTLCYAYVDVAPDGTETVVTTVEGTPVESDEPSPLGDVPLETEYGTFMIPEAYADETAYPWVCFNSDGTFITAGDIFCTSDDQGNSMLKQNYHQAPEETHYIFLRRDFTHSRNETFWNFASLRSNIVVDLQGHTFTIEKMTANGLLFGEGKSTYHVRFTMTNGKLINQTSHPIFRATPASKSGSHFDLTFDNITVITAGALSAATENANKPQKYSMTFIDSTLDVSGVSASTYLFATGTHYENVEANVLFRGGTIKGDLTRFASNRSISTNHIFFEKNDSGVYTTNTLPTGTAATTRIFTSDEGLMTFKNGVADPKDANYTVYTLTPETSPLATKYGWLPDDDSSMVLFKLNSQEVAYSGEMIVDYYDKVEHESAFQASNNSSETFVLYFRKDVGTSAFVGSFYNFSNKSNAIIFEMNGHTLTLGKSLFRAQVKRDGMYQKIVVNGGTINLNGLPLIETGSNEDPQNGTVDFTFNQVNLSNIKSSSILIKDDVSYNNSHTFNIDFNDCTFNTTSAYVGKFFNFVKTNPVHNVRINGGTINAGKGVLPTLFYAVEGNSSTLTFTPGADGKYPVLTTAKTSTEVDATPITTLFGTAQYVNVATEGSRSTWNLMKVTPHGYIDEEHFDESKYPIVMFTVGDPTKTWYPEAFGGESGNTIVNQFFRGYSEKSGCGFYNGLDSVLFLRTDYALTGSNYWAGNLKCKFTIDLNGHTLTPSTLFLYIQARTAGTADVIVKNGTIMANAKDIINYGTTTADKKHSNITFENVVFENITKSIFGNPAFTNTVSSSHPNRDKYVTSMNVTFNNCTFNVSSKMTAALFNFGTDERGTVQIQVNGGTFNLANNKYNLFATGWDGRTIAFGTYDGKGVTFNIANTVDLSEKTELGADGLPMQMRKSADDGTTATYILSPFSVVSAYLNITNDFNFIYRVFLPAGFENPTATFTVDQHTITVTDYTKDANGLYLFKLCAIGPHRMADTVYASITASYGEETVTATNDTLSVKTYADRVRAENADDAKLINLLDTLLMYGANAQMYMNHNTDNLVAELGGLVEIPAGTIVKNGTANADYSIVGAGLRLGGAFDFGVQIKAADLAGLTLFITKGEESTEIPLTENMLRDGYYVVYYNGLIASELSEDITFALMQNGAQIGQSLTLSANAYLAQLQNEENETLTNLAKALYLYSLAAESYHAENPPEDVDYVPSGVIVNKGGAEGAVSYVIDDNDKATATFANSLLSKYSNLTLSYAMRTYHLATLLTEEGEDGLLRYRRANDGSYLYTLNEANVAFWRDITASDRVEIINHTHTHNFFGTNDDGGEFKYLKNSNLENVLTSTQPVGSSSKEIYAAMQILKEVFGDLDPKNTLSFIAAGIGVYTQDKEVNGEMIVSYSHYFDELLSEAIAEDKLVTVRGTFGATDTNTASKVVTKDSLITDAQRRKVNSYMIVNANAGENIENWTAYIDHALAAGGWAPFCIHLITETEHSSHHILQSQADALFAYTASLGDRVWVATYTDASLYFCEWASARVDCKYMNGELVVSVTDEENNEIFDMPLTVKVTIPPSFAGSAKLNGEALEVHTNEDGTQYVLVDIVPDSGAIVITK